MHSVKRTWLPSHDLYEDWILFALRLDIDVFQFRELREYVYMQGKVGKIMTDNIDEEIKGCAERLLDSGILDRIMRGEARAKGNLCYKCVVSKPGIAERRIEKLGIKSNIQKIERPFSVYTPANYKTDGPPNALLILFDGEDLPDDPYPVTTLNNLIAASKIPPTVAVFVENVPRRRLVDLGTNPEFAEFSRHRAGAMDQDALQRRKGRDASRCRWL